MTQSHTCPGCGAKGMQVFHRQEDVPTNSCILLESREEALAYPRGRIDLAFCPACGFISNMAFDPKLTEYSGRYEETQGFSGTFNAFHRNLAQRLIERHGLREKDILEIGCGKGEFLLLLAEMGNNRGVGFDPGVHHERVTGEAAERVRFIADFYSEKYTDYAADFVCCKMTLEHIHPTAEFVGTVRRAVGDRFDTTVFFQIPESIRILKDCAFEDIYYEHCSYFTKGSLARLFRSQGFDVLNLEAEYADQYLTIEAKPAHGAPTPPLPEEDDFWEIARYVDQFPGKFHEKQEIWRQRVEEAATKGQKVVLWGSGSKGVSFLTTLALGNAIEYAVDINPYRHGHYMPTTAQKIVSPEFLREYRPDVVILMNSIYREEVSQDLQRLGLAPDLYTL
ncbi:class I SAM-dependent methyltransferase [Methylocaldum sp.]|uniref:class I SAM-dependent methyltransferase n=1 Tax=Methylocaldum sp. TaxID=1969727 RepID=UPI002D6E0D5C|nr:class I SAM-dependent methyltransferase [Methylocaldum sp.]HYE35698.1 class I SAM-dependent methyltransferase [Methylocaldum sp.]